MNQTPCSTIAQRIVYARQVAGLSAGQLAKVTGLSLADIKAWEGGSLAGLRSGVRGKIADACSVSLDWLDYNTETAIPKETLALLEAIPEADRLKLIRMLKVMRGAA